MKQNYKDDNFLARWVANDLSPEELKQFQDSEGYQQFKAINDASQKLKAPDYNQSKAFKTINEKTSLTNKNTKVINFIPNWLYGAVASIAIVFSLFYFNNNSTTSFSTSYGEQLTVTLPDNSIVHLSPNSILEYDKKDWKKSRNLDLTGEAYFEVEKGQTFTVNTKEGNVTVLGTKFTVNASNNFFEVLCYEGKVKTFSTKNNHEVILTQGKAYRAYNSSNENWAFNEQTPSWIDGESSFTNTPLNQVIIALQKQYNLKFDTSKIDTKKDLQVLLHIRMLI